MNQLELSEIIDKVVNKSDLTTKDIPSLDLYMDQIMTLFDDHLQDNKRFVDDKLLTKTMINNYSKAGVIKPVKGKKYTKEQIIGMLLVYNLKNTITIQEIKQVLAPVYANDESLENIYDQFIEIKKFQSDQLKPLVLKTVENFNLDIIKENKTTKEDKENHGFGLITINNIISKYNGNIDYSIHDQYLIADITILNVL